MRNVICIVAITVVTSCVQPEDKVSDRCSTGKSLTGWKTTGNWVVEKDDTNTLKQRSGKKGWLRYDAYLTTDRKYGNFQDEAKRISYRNVRIKESK